MLSEERPAVTCRGDTSLLVSTNSVSLFFFFLTFLELPEHFYPYHHLSFLNDFPSNSGLSQFFSPQNKHRVLEAELPQLCSLHQ